MLKALVIAGLRLVHACSHDQGCRNDEPNVNKMNMNVREKCPNVWHIDRKDEQVMFFHPNTLDSKFIAGPNFLLFHADRVQEISKVSFGPATGDQSEALK
jgi:hypothetical protein